MVKIKEMPYEEKYKVVLSNVKVGEFGKDFVEKHLGSKAAEDLQKEWQKGFKPISESASEKQKYETALANWIWKGGTLFGFVRNRIGEDGINQLVDADVKALEKSIPGATVFLLSIIRAISPGMAFNMTAKQMAYQMQIAGPVTVCELSRNKAVMDTPHCQCLDYTGGEETCLISCQRVPPIAFREKFGVDMKYNRQWNSCKTTLSPSKK